MLAANPIEGTALERLWQGYSEQGKIGELLGEYEAQKTFSSEMVLGHLLRKAGRAADAAGAYRRAAALDAASPLPLLALGRLERAEGRHAEAAEALSRAVELLGENRQKTDALLELGAAWLAAGDGEKASAAWEKTVALDPENLDLHQRLADSYVRQHLSDRAIPHLEHIERRAVPAERARALQQLANIHQARGHQDATIAALEKALTYTAPGNWLRAELQSQLIRVHQRYHRERELEQRWTKFAEENPRDLGGYLQLIDLYARLGEQPQELAWLEKLTVAAPKNSEYRLRLSRLLVEMDRPDDAVRVYDVLVAAQPGNADLLFERARLDLQRDQPQLAGERVAAFLARRTSDESIRGKALGFFEANRLYDFAEKQLAADASTGKEEALRALANFLFARDRDADAERVIERLIQPTASAAHRATAHFQAAQIFKANADSAAAVRSVREAIALDPDHREFHALLGELEASRGRYVEAQRGFERAFALSRTPAEALEADQRLYDSLRNQQPPEKAAKRLGPPRLPSAEVAATSAAAQGVLLGLLREAVEQPTEERWLRVARWQLWSRNTRGAADAAAHALAVNPASLAAHEFLVKLHHADPQSPLAQKHLRELMALDPANRPAYLRRIGQAEMQAGRMDEALKIFAEIANASPGNLDALADLAIAQQRAERWTDALVTLQQVHRLSPPSRKSDAAASLLRIYERLAMKQPAAELLLAQVDAAQEKKERFTAFAELLAHCTKHGLLAWARGEFQQRRKLFANDYFTETAFGQILKAQGNKAAAFEVLADAAFSAPDPAESLPELVREAETLRKFKTAIALQSQLVRMVPKQDSAGLERLAQLQEKAGEFARAGETWERIATRFSRDVGTLERGVHFQRRCGALQRALDWLRRIVALDPANLGALSSRAHFAMGLGQAAEAQAALEQILLRTSGEDHGAPLRLPTVNGGDANRIDVAGRSPGVDAMRELRRQWLDAAAIPDAAGERELRQRAIGDLGRLHAAQGDEKALAQWVEQWLQPAVAPNEKLLALSAAGASAALFEKAATLLPSAGADAQTAQAFLTLALQTGEFARAAGWVQDRRRTSVEREALLPALDRYLETSDRYVHPRLVPELFPPHARSHVKAAAERFGQRGFFHEAARLGERVFDGLTTQRAAFGIQLAAWHLALGKIDRTREVLRLSIGTPGESFEAPVYENLRALYLLEPAGERRGFAREYLRQLNSREHPLHAALAGALLAGLAGDEKTAQTELQRVLDLRAFGSASGQLSDEDRVLASTRFWDFILIAGGQLHDWGLDPLAQFWWERALSDSAWVRLQAQLHGVPVQDRTGEVRMRLMALRIAHAEAWQVDELLEPFLRQAGSDQILMLAETLEAAEAHPRAIQIFRRLWEADPSNPRALSDLLKAARESDDFETLEEVLARAVEGGASRAHDGVRRDLALQLAEIYERRQEWGKALEVLKNLLEAAPHESRLISRLAQLHESAGQTAEGEAAYRRLLGMDPGNLPARLALAAMLEKRGEIASAIECLEHATGADVAARLAPLYVKGGRIDDAFAVLDRVPMPAHVPAALLVVDALVTTGEAREGRSVLRNALARCTDAQAGFPLQSRMIELLAPETDAAAIPREIRRLRQLAGNESGLLLAYYELLQRHAARLKVDPEFARELADAWDHGRGSMLAGVAQLQRNLQHGEPAAAAAVWTLLLGRPDLSDLAAEGAASAFRAAGDLPRETEALGRLARLDAGRAERLKRWAGALQLGGHSAAAATVAEELAARAVFDASLLPLAAQTFVEVGALERAAELYAEAVRADPTGNHHAVHLEYARLLLRQENHGAARRILKTAHRNPANGDFSALAAWARQAGGHAKLAEFGLSAGQLAAARQALFTELENTGNAREAIELLDEYPQMLGTGMAARVQALAETGGVLEEAAALLERVLGQAALPEAEPTSALARIYLAWAEAELHDLKPDVAFAHLRRAHALVPELWAAAERLSAMYVDRKEPKLAAQTLRSFLAASKDAAERDKARQALARLPNI